MIPGIDISHYQGTTINWDLLAKNARFIGIKATEGPGNTDPTLAAHRDGFRGSGLAFAAYYHVARPGDPVAQATRFAAAVGPLQANEHLCLDLERSSGVDFPFVDAFYGALVGNGTPPLTTTDTFCYASAGSWKANGGPATWDLAKVVRLWLCDYIGAVGRLPAPWTSYLIRQYTDQGRCPGISGACDLNWFNGSDADLAAFAASPATSLTA
jgi:lysozyme